VPCAVVVFAGGDADEDADDACDEGWWGGQDEGDGCAEVEGLDDCREELWRTLACLFEVWMGLICTWLKDVALRCMFCMNTSR
jgi:hypothetical protein